MAATAVAEFVDGCTKTEVLDSQGISRIIFIPMHLEKLYMDAKKDRDNFNEKIQDVQLVLDTLKCMLEQELKKMCQKICLLEYMTEL